MADKKKPNLFIAGGSKCGTSTMRAWLNHHPDIWMEIPIELNYFAKGETEMHIKDLTKKEYLRYFRNAGNQKYIGEKSNFCLYAPSAPKKIKEFSPQAKIIIMIRNPIDAIRSMHFMLYNSNWYVQEDEPDLAKAIEKQPERKKKNNLIFERYYYKDLVKFDEYIKRFFDVFGRKNVKVVVMDDLKNNPDKVYREILGFLDLPYHKIDFDVHNASKVGKFKLYPKLIKRIPTSLKKITRGFIPFQLYTSLKNISTKRTEKNPIDPGLKERLKREFKPRINRMERLLNKDLSSWYK